jgi:sodium-dependent dicarboxylate transporter 2/3/5
MRLKNFLVLVGFFSSLLLPGYFFEDSFHGKACGVAAACLFLWLFEVVPSFVPTLVLILLGSQWLGASNAELTVSKFIGWGMDPVLLLFFGGFCLSVAISEQSLDEHLVRAILRVSRKNKKRLLAVTLAASAFLSMWMSNVAAATLLLVAFKGIYSHRSLGREVKVPLLLAIALGSSFGGMMTPLGSGPNGIALAAIQPYRHITFLDWMFLSFPIGLGLLAISYFYLVNFYKMSGDISFHENELPKLDKQFTFNEKLTCVLGASAILLYVSEPLHGISAPIVSLGLSIALVVTGVFTAADLRKIDWSMLMLLAGGLMLGRLIEETGLLELALQKINAAGFRSVGLLGVLVWLCAFMSALMSNTATATILIPASLKLLPGMPEVSIVLAIAASLGIPFVISTPMNVAIRAEGATAKDIFIPGMLLMVIGCLLVSITGLEFLQFIFKASN